MTADVPPPSDVDTDAIVFALDNIPIWTYDPHAQRHDAGLKALETIVDGLPGQGKTEHNHDDG